MRSCNNIPPAARFQASGRSAVSAAVVRRRGRAEEPSISNFLAQAEQAEQRGDVSGALGFYSKAERLAATNCTDLCLVTRVTATSCTSPVRRKFRRPWLLGPGRRSARGRGRCQERHGPPDLGGQLCEKFSLRRQLNQGEVVQGREDGMRNSIALDPKQDVGYYLLDAGMLKSPTWVFTERNCENCLWRLCPSQQRRAIINFKKASTLAPKRIIHISNWPRLMNPPGRRTRAKRIGSLRRPQTQ